MRSQDSAWLDAVKGTGIVGFNRNRSLADKNDNTILVREDPKQKTPKRKIRRRSISKSQSGSTKKAGSFHYI